MNTNITKKQVAIVTGASSGVGLGITQALLQHGYHVVANSRNISKSRDLKPSSDLILVDGDISKQESAIKVADVAIKHFDRIDLLVNNAGIYIRKPFTDYTPADFELMIGTNVAGYFFITQKVVAQMCKQKSGHIMGISTVCHDHVVVDYPQSRERIVSRRNIQALRGYHPSKPAGFTIRRIIGNGDLWITEYMIIYDGRPVPTVSIMEFRDGKVIHETQYFAEPFEPPAWRAQWVERMI
jgi:hypothetical protein